LWEQKEEGGNNTEKNQESLIRTGPVIRIWKRVGQEKQKETQKNLAVGE